MQPLRGIAVVTPEHAIARASPTRARMDPIPALGQHTDAILHELGCSSEDIGRMREAQAI